MRRLKKIKMHMYMAYILIIILVICSVIPLPLLWKLEQHTLVKVILSLVILVAVLLLGGWCIEKAFRILIERQSNNDEKTVSVHVEFPKHRITHFQKISEYSRLWYIINRFLDTAIIYEEFDSTNVDEARLIIKKHNKIIKREFKEANETNPTKRFWNLKINIFMVNDETLEEDAKGLVSTLNNDRMYEIGKFSMVYIKGKNIAILPTFKGEDLNIFTLKHYIDCIKIVSEIFVCPRSTFFDVL